MTAMLLDGCEEDRKREGRGEDGEEDLVGNFEADLDRASREEAEEEAENLLGDFEEEFEQAMMAEAEEKESRAREQWKMIEEGGEQIRAAAEGLMRMEGTSMATGLRMLEEAWSRMLRGEELGEYKGGTEELRTAIQEEVDTMCRKVDGWETMGKKLAEKVMKRREQGAGARTAEEIEAKYWDKLLRPTVEATRRVEGWWAEAKRASAVAADRT